VRALSAKQVEGRPPRRYRRALPYAAAALVAAVLLGSVLGAMRLGPRSGAPAEVSLADPTAAASSAPAEPGATSGPSVERGQNRAGRGIMRPSPSPSTTTRSPRPAQTQPNGGGSVVGGGSCQASFYDEGQRTANGEWFDPNAYTAAHRTLPFNTRLRVTNVANGKSVIVRINDRGPYVGGRCLDLSRAAFGAIASLNSGVASVRYEVLG
jgi:peptidoglycan lytic transglycosylase